MKSVIAEYLYTTILKPAPLKWLINHLILLIIPKYVIRNESFIYLNEKDPVISGALYFDVYEPEETRFIVNHLKEGDVFVDIGANVGYYTAMAMNCVKEKGLVISLEPDPESFYYLEKTVEANKYKNVKLYNYAASDKESKRILYLSNVNRGDNRFHDFKNVLKRIEINTLIIDNLFEKNSIDIKKRKILMKMDIQGSEGLALAGARNTIRGAAAITLIFEFWPAGLKAMSTDPEELLLELESLGLCLYELKREGLLVEVTDKEKLIGDHQGRKYVNIIGKKQACNNL